MSSSSIAPDYRFFITLPVFGKIPLHPHDIMKDLKKKENAPLWAQFFKYGVCGVLSLVVFSAVVGVFALIAPDYLAKSQGKETLQLHTTIVFSIGFILSNFFAFFSNRWFVFTPGKHSFWKEMFIFTLISGISFLGGHFGKSYVIELGCGALAAAGCFALSSALINFVARKFVVFEN